MRRRLQEEDTSYQEILDDVRAELASRYLTKEKRGIEEVAFLLGFSDPSAFTKAFRRWTGQDARGLRAHELVVRRAEAAGFTAGRVSGAGRREFRKAACVSYPDGSHELLPEARSCTD